MNPTSKPHPIRALIAIGMAETAIVVATDSQILANDMESINDRTEELGLGIAGGHPPGLYLWTGTQGEYCSGPDYVTEYEYVGKLREADINELQELLAMEPPEGVAS